MKPRVIGIYLMDREFALKLVDYWSRKAPQYRYRVYSRPEKFCEDLISEPVYLLISDEEGYRRLAAREGMFTPDRVGRLVQLSETGAETGMLWENRRISVIRKYQPADVLLADALGMREKLFPLVGTAQEALMIGESSAALQLLEEAEEEQQRSGEIPEEVPAGQAAPESHVAGFGGRVIGVFSPIGRCGKTRLTLELARQCAAAAPALYLSLEMFTDLYGRLLTSGGEDIADFLYALMEGRLAAEMHEEMVGSGGVGNGNDGAVRCVIVTAAANPEDVTEIDGGALAEIIRQAGYAGFAAVVIDVGSSFPRPLEVLELCDVIYAPVTESESSRRKWRHFSEYVRKRGAQDLAERIVTLLLPDTGDAYDGEGVPEASPELTRQVRKLLWET